MVTTTWTQTAGMSGDTDTDNIENYAEQAEASKDAAAASETAAAASATAAAASEADAESAEVNASASETAAAASATSASSSATAASNSASSASTSATAAASSASAASASETASAASETAAATSESNASTSETNAATSASNASTSETNAATSATNASTSEANAAASETAAAASETAAAASETAAATSETNAATSETNAATFETNASTSASSASTSASNAATSATAASTAQTAAEAARDATLTAYDNFDDRYLGAKASAPTVDNDGDALVAGALYFDSTAGAMKVYTGSSWVAAYVSGTDYLPFSGGTMTGDVGHGDGVKATFGASQDLQVYHSGTNSLIQDLGTGILQLASNGSEIKLSVAGGDNMARFFTGGESQLFCNGGLKLATKTSGINVTGTVVADGLTVDGDATVQGASGATLTLKSTSTSLTTNDLLGQVDFYNNDFSGDGPSVQARISATTPNTIGNGSVLQFFTTNAGTGTEGSDPISRMQINHLGDISFYDDTGSTAKLTWDASDEALEFGDNVKATFGASSDLRIYHNGSNSYIDDTGVGSLFIRSNELRINKYTGEFMLRAEADGPVELFYDNSKKLETTSTGIAVTGSVDFGNWTITESGGSLYFATGGTNKMKLDASGNLDVVGSVNSNATIT